MMSGKRLFKRTKSNRVAFYVIIGVAVILMLCTLVTRAVGWSRFCGGGLILIGLFFLLLAENKRWPAVIVLIGLVLFFVDLQQLLALVGL